MNWSKSLSLRVDSTAVLSHISLLPVTELPWMYRFLPYHHIFRNLPSHETASAVYLRSFYDQRLHLLGRGISHLLHSRRGFGLIYETGLLEKLLKKLLEKLL